MRRGAVTYSCDEVLAVLGHHDIVALGVGEIDGLLLDELVHFRIILRACVERREPHNHLVRQNAECPPVHWERVPSLHQNLRSQVIWCPAERERLRVSF